MATSTATSYGSANTDDVLMNAGNTQGINNNASQYDTGYCDLSDHPSASYAAVSGYVFTIPSLPGWSGSNADINDCYVEWAHPYGAATTSLKSNVKLIYSTPSGGSFPSSFNSSNSPKSMYDAATGVSAVAWNTGGGFSGSWATNTYNRGPSLTTHLKDAFTAGATAGSSKVTVIVHGVTSAGPNNGIRANSYNAGSYRPRLVVSYESTPQNATPTPSPVSATAVVKQPLTRLTKNYTSAPTTIAGDVYLPSTTKPTDGYPAVFYVHGGRFITGSRLSSTYDENYLPEQWAEALLSAGYAVISLDYLLATETVGWNYGTTHPMPVKHVKTALRYWQDNAGTYGLDPERFVVAGHSAGAEIAALAGLSIGDTTTYTFRQNGTPSGRTGMGKTSDYAYEVNGNYRTYGTQGAGLNYYVTSGTEPDAIKGILLYACPVNLEGIKSYNSPSNTSAVNSYTGFSSGEGVTINGEGSVDKYIAGTTGSVYAGYSHTPSVPIAHYRSTGDTTIIPDAVSATPLYNTLNAAGVDVSKAEIASGSNPTASQMSATGLTRFSVSGTHAQTVFNSDPDEVITWLDLVTAPSTPATATPSPVTATGDVPSATTTTGASTQPDAVAATAAVLGPAISTDSTASTAAVEATASVGAPSIATSAIALASTVSATAAVPAISVAVSAETAPSTITATADIPAASVSTGSSVSAAPSTVSATADILSVSVGAGVAVYNPAVTAVASVPSASASAGVAASAQTVTAAADVLSPVVSADTDCLVSASVVTAMAAVLSPSIPSSSGPSPHFVRIGSSWVRTYWRHVYGGGQWH